jgi:hypothetical protein
MSKLEKDSEAQNGGLTYSCLQTAFPLPGCCRRVKIVPTREREGEEASKDSRCCRRHSCLLLARAGIGFTRKDPSDENIRC